MELEKQIAIALENAQGWGLGIQATAQVIVREVLASLPAPVPAQGTPPAQLDEFDFMSRKVIFHMVEILKIYDRMKEPFRSGGITAIEELYHRITNETAHLDWEEPKWDKYRAAPAPPRERQLIERAIKMAWKAGSEGASEGSITYEDVVSGADYD